MLTTKPVTKKNRQTGKQNQIIEYVLGLLLLFLLMPVAFGAFFNVSTTNWDDTTKTVWAVLPILGVIGAFGIVIYMGYSHFSKKN